MTKLDIIKMAVSTIVGIGTTKIVKDIIAHNVDIDTPVDQVTVVAGSIVIGTMAADATKEYTDAKIDEIAAWVREAKQAANS